MSINNDINVSQATSIPVVIHATDSQLDVTSLSPVIPAEPVYKVSKRRWLVLFAILIFGMVNSFADAENCILHTITDLLGVTVNQYVYISLIYTYVPLLTAFPSAWLVDKFGIKPTLQIASLSTIIKTVSRVLLFSTNTPQWEQLKIVYWFIANMIGVVLLVLFFSTPLKISEQWFKESERSTSWSVMISAYSVGSSLAAFTFPRLLAAYRSVQPLIYVNIMASVMSIIVVFSCITVSKPKYPPSQRSLASSNNKQESFIVTIRKVSKHRDLLLNSLHIAFFDGVYIAVMSVQQDIMLASGHSEIFIGNIMSINNIIGLTMLIVLSTFVHRVKNLYLMCIIGSVLKTTLFIIYSASILYPVQEWVVIITTIVYALCRSWLLPNYNNMTAKIASGYVSEATASSIQACVIIVTITVNQIAFMSLKGTKGGKPDYTYSLLFSAIAAIVNSLIYVTFFKGQQKKQEVISDDNDSNGQD